MGVVACRHLIVDDVRSCFSGTAILLFQFIGKLFYTIWRTLRKAVGSMVMHNVTIAVGATLWWIMVVPVTIGMRVTKPTSSNASVFHARKILARLETGQGKISVMVCLHSSCLPVIYPAMKHASKRAAETVAMPIGNSCQFWRGTSAV